MNDPAPFLDRSTDQTLGIFVVDGPRSLMLDPERDTWWEADCFVRRFISGTLLESLIFFRLPNYFDELNLPPYITRYCHWNSSIARQDQVPFEQYRLKTNVNYSTQTMAQVTEVKGHLRQLARRLVGQTSDQTTSHSGVIRSAPFIRFEVDFYPWTSVRFDFREESLGPNDESWDFMTNSLAAASDRPDHALPFQICERFETNSFGSFVDIAPSDLTRIHEFV